MVGESDTSLAQQSAGQRQRLVGLSAATLSYQPPVSQQVRGTYARSGS